jgi:hypothetical protein
MTFQWGTWIWRATAVVLLFAGLYNMPLAVSRAQTETVASLDPVQGWVQHRAADAAEDDWQTVTERQLVTEGDWIRTDSYGLAYLTFFEGVEAEILPDSVVTVSHLDIKQTEHDGPFTITLVVLLGDTLNSVERVVDAESRYEVRTPNAAITVRGTHFWVSVSLEQETTIRAVDGEVLVTGLDPQGEVIGELLLEPGYAVTVQPDGTPGEPDPIGELPEYPIEAPLVPETCGNGACDPDEELTCPMDCYELPLCGDGECDESGGENPITCPDDCGPALDEPDHKPLDGESGSAIHFFWGEGRCDVDPPGETVINPVLLHWGVGCFDSAAQASAHPHPADYQLSVDGQAYDMSSLRQTNVHPGLPYCSWAWGFEMGPITLPPGEHELTLVETITDTWSTSGDGDRGRSAGQTATLTCTIRFDNP